MTELSDNTISLKSIDTEWIQDVEDNREAVQFRVLLSEAPSDGWIHEFDELYHSAPYKN